MSIKSITVFCGSRSGSNPLFEAHTKKLGHLLAEKNIAVIYGGGNKGLMGATANAVIEKNGVIIGIMPELLQQWEHQHEGITELLIVDTMHTRKRLLYEKCDAAIILPGGFGTLDEVFEMLTWNQLKIHSKEIFILNTAGFYDHLIKHIHSMHDNEFLYDHPDLKIKILNEPEDILPYLD